MLCSLIPLLDGSSLTEVGTRRRRVFLRKFLCELLLGLSFKLKHVELLFIRIFYPLSVDQPGNALILTVNHEAGFELLSVRTGLGERVPYRCRNGPAPEFSVEGVKREVRELLQRLKGEEGQRIRANLERLGDAYRMNWEEGGEAKRNLEGFMKQYIDRA
jgi:hypothetical protein